MTQTHTCAAILITAPASGQGKTTIVSALARLHTRQGRRVRVFKCGPDFLDPIWHQLACGHPVYQMDLWITGEADAKARLHAAAKDCDLIIVEGVMGLFDGEPSAADLADCFDLPVLAVIDASAMAGTFGALAFGLQHYRPGLKWAGVLANRVASDQHGSMLAQSVSSKNWLGALMRNAALTLPERHLGLTVATELSDAMKRLDAAADALQQTPLGQMDVDALSRWHVDFPAPDERALVPTLLQGRRVAVARDAAFCFIYQANLDMLRQLGAETVFFSPVNGDALPECDAVWLPSGYPELHAQQLARHHEMRASLRAHVDQGLPVWAECGGMMVLFDEIECVDGDTHTMWGLLPGRVQMQQRLAALGSQQLTLPLGVLRGHTFHYSTATSSARVVTRTARPNNTVAQDAGEAVYVHRGLRASYFHPWFASCPEAAASLFLPEAST
jgi:cobyrinic acid a,c-diamide synthase